MMVTTVARLAILALLVALVRPAAAEPLSGVFYGIEEADGASIVIEPARDGYKGTFVDRQGNSQKFKGDRLEGDAAELVLDLDGRTVLVRAEPLPFGIEATVVPVAKNGKLLVAESRVLYFVRRGLEVPKADPDFVNPPRDANTRISANSFLASYEFWGPTGVRNGYLALPERFRTLMRLFPAVQLDVIWKLCLAPSAEQALAIALRGQGVTCAQVIDGIADAQRKGSFNDYKHEVARQKKTLRMVVRCADRYPESREDCDAAARELSAQAVAMETAATVLSRFR